MKRLVPIVSAFAVVAATVGLTSCASQSEPERTTVSEEPERTTVSEEPELKTVSEEFAMPTETAAMYRGLPNSIANNPDGPAVTVSSTETANYQRFEGDPEFLPGNYPEGVKVKRGNRPEISNISLNDNGEVSATVKAQKAMVGEENIPAGAKELLAVNLVVTDNNPNPSRRGVLFQDLQWFEISGNEINQNVKATIDPAVAEQLKGLESEQRGEAIVVYAVQVIDVDGVLFGDRYTADHIKGSTLNLAESQAAPQGTAQGVNLTLSNSDFQTGTNSSSSINLVTQAVSCMQTNGSGASDVSVFNISGWGAGATVEGFMASTAAGQAANQAPGSQDIVDAMTSDYAEAVIETMMGATLDWTTAAFDVFEEIAQLSLEGCSGVSNPGMFTAAATDPYGNATQIGYSLNTDFNNTGSGIDTGGIADVNTAYNFYNNYSAEGGPIGTRDYLASDYLENNFGPGPANTSFVEAPPEGPDGQSTTPISGSGGDAGLSWQALTSGGYPQLGTENGYPQIQLNATWGPMCSSLIGGTWGTGKDASNEQEGGSIPGFTQNPCAGWSGAPTPIDLPPAPSMVSPPSITPTTVVPGTVMTANPGSWEPSDAAITYTWLVNGRPQAGQTTSTFTIPGDTGAGSTVEVSVCASSSQQSACTNSNSVTVSAPPSGS